MNQDPLDDIWAETPSSQFQPTYAPRSRQPWQGLEPPEVQLARVQEGMDYLRLTVKVSADRLQLLAQRSREQEAWRIKVTETLAQVLPIIEQHKRWQDRLRFALATLRYTAAAATLYLAVSGKIQWPDALRALGSIFGVG